MISLWDTATLLKALEDVDVPAIFLTPEASAALDEFIAVFEPTERKQHEHVC